jgi:hypothetical protein
MDWETELISIFFLVDQHSGEIFSQTERMSPNNAPQFTDTELGTIYLYCTKEGYRSQKQMHQYASKHLRSWFPALPSYQAFSRRLNRLGSALCALANRLLAAQPSMAAYYAGRKQEAITDSLPIHLAKGTGCARAKVASEIADKGYCSTKKLWYHGIKLHLLGWVIPHKMPQPAAIILSSASAHDGTVFFEQMAPLNPHIVVYADKAYDFPQQRRTVKEQFDIDLMPIHKRIRGEAEHDAHWHYFNTALSRIRQPIEAAFNWLIERTGIQNAAKCRSTTGLLLHVFGKIATALYILLLFNS